ncbi:MAG: hypothetical protein ACI8RD_013963 [Bacillariaceae sp.]|jgi:hypothetical protein
MISDQRDIIVLQRDTIDMKDQFINTSQVMVDVLRDRIRIQEQMIQLYKTNMFSVVLPCMCICLLLGFNISVAVLQYIGWYN